MRHFFSRKALVLAFAIFLLFVGSVRIAPPDLAFYYAYAHSLLYDVDFSFANQYAQFPFAIHELYLTSQGYPANDWPIGTGAAWLPFLGLAWIAMQIGAGLGLDLGQQGYGWFSQWAVTFGATLLYSGGTVYLAYRLCRREAIEPRAALWAAVLIALGSSFTYQLYVNSADSHPPSAFFITAFLLLWLRFRDSGSLPDAVLAGYLLGMAALVRPHNAIFILTPIMDLVRRRQALPSLKVNALKYLALLFISLLVFLPQMMVWRELYGSWFAVPRAEEVLWLQPHLWEMLFSDYHGMLSWSPLFGLGLLGLLIERRWWPYAVPVLIQIYVYSCNLAWWAGGSFGNRRMVGCAALFILGLAVLLRRVPSKFLKTVCIGFGGWTMLLLIAEVGETVRLDRYQTWAQLFAAIPQGFWSGLVNHVTRAQWGEHTFERWLGFVAVLLAFAGGYYAAMRWQRVAFRGGTAAVLGLVLLFNGFNAWAMFRSPRALAQADVSGYSTYDRFTWVVYYEGGFYHIQSGEYSQAMEDFVAAILAEPRHSQPWMYLSMAASQYNWNRLAYLTAGQALQLGQTRHFFLQHFESLLTRRLFNAQEKAYLYYNQRGVVRTYLRQWQGARSDFNMALTLNPDYETAERNLALLQQHQEGNPSPLWWE